MKTRRIASPYVAALRLVPVVSFLVAVSCSDSQNPIQPDGDPDDPTNPGANAAIFVGTGDIGMCRSSEPDEETALLLDAAVAQHSTSTVTVFTTGDNAYPDGTTQEFMDCYDPNWGRHKERTRPSPGNHDYHMPGAAGYFDYFGAAAGKDATDRTGYYSYEIGSWHAISLNSNTGDLSDAEEAAQLAWLEADLAASTATCTVAYWHHPRFSSGDHGSSTRSRPFWEALYAAGADIVLAGHDHTYERFAPQDPDGAADAAYGIVEFVVGTGGASLYDFNTPEPNSEFRYNVTHGVLKLALGSGGYAWEFIATDGSVVDSGTGSCHPAPGG